MDTREVNFEDHRGVAALMTRHGFRAKTKDEWEHLWKANPALPHLKTPLPIGWVIEDPGQHIVGYLGNIPLLYTFRGRSLLATATHAWVVDAAFRSRSLLLVARYLAQQGVDLFLNTTANREASRVFEALKVSRVPTDSYDVSLFWITNHYGFTNSWLRQRKHPSIPFLSYPLSSFLQASDTIKRRGIRRQSSEAIVVSQQGFDARFNKFWDELKKRDTVLCSRSKPALEWHYKYSSQKGPFWIYTHSRGSRLTAYAVFQAQNNPEYGLKRMRLTDFQTVEESSSTLPPIMAEALRRCRNEGIHMLEVFGFNHEKRAVLKKYAPHERQLPSWMFFYRAKDSKLNEELANSDVWDPCFYDGDGAL